MKKAVATAVLLLPAFTGTTAMSEQLDAKAYAALLHSERPYYVLTLDFAEALGAIVRLAKTRNPDHLAGIENVARTTLAAAGVRLP